MDESSSPTSDPAPESLDPAGELLAAYIDRCQDGTAEPRADFLAQHPEHAAVLERRLACLAPISLLDPVQSELRMIDGYVVRGLLGQGGMGIVYDAYDPRLNRPVAIKVLAGLGALAGERGERFQREIATLARIRHPHIVGVHGSGSIGGAPYFVMERVDGRSLSKLIPEGEERLERAAVRERVELAAKIARALEHAHEHGVIHRDVKPHNIVVHEGGEPVLIDFGLARDVSNVSASKAGGFLGTVEYSAPEQARGERVDARADVYGLAATLYHVLTGELPYPARTPAELVRSADAAPPRRASHWNRALAGDLSTVLERALEPDPRLRYASCADFADDLEAVLADRPIRAQRTGVGRKLLRFVRRHPVSVGLVTVSAGAALLSSVVYLRGLIQTARAIEFDERFVNGRTWLQAHTSEGQDSDRAALARAEAELARCLELDPDDVDALSTLADVVDRQGRREEARALLERAQRQGATGFYFRRLEHEFGLGPFPELPSTRDPEVLRSSRSIDLSAMAISRVHAGRGLIAIEGAPEMHFQEALTCFLELYGRGEPHFVDLQFLNVTLSGVDDPATPFRLYAIRKTMEQLRAFPEAYAAAYNLAAILYDVDRLSELELDEITGTLDRAGQSWRAAGGGADALEVLFIAHFRRWEGLPGQQASGDAALALVDEVGDDALLEFGMRVTANAGRTLRREVDGRGYVQSGPLVLYNPWGARLLEEGELAYVPAVQTLVLHGQYERALELLARRSFVNAGGVVAGPAHLTLDIRRSFAEARRGRFAPDSENAAAFLSSVEFALEPADLAAARAVLEQLRKLESEAAR